ncbi:hypothetical protein BV25DRAFT_1808501, partial [Artomyces pyxidatus]
ALTLLHGQGLVHGDVRLPDILCDGKTVQLVDFDWAGQEGEVRYQVNISTVISWPEDVSSTSLIKKEHDLIMLGKAFLKTVES